MTLHFLSRGCPKPDQTETCTLVSYISSGCSLLHHQAQPTPSLDPKQLQYELEKPGLLASYPNKLIHGQINLLSLHSSWCATWEKNTIENRLTIGTHSQGRKHCYYSLQSQERESRVLSWQPQNQECHPFCMPLFSFTLFLLLFINTAEYIAN